MKIRDVIASLESLAPLSLQEGYDNAGLIAGDASMDKDKDGYTNIEEYLNSVVPQVGISETAKK